mgnify:FL=1|jgi:hypothetical protein
MPLGTDAASPSVVMADMYRTIVNRVRIHNDKISRIVVISLEDENMHEIASASDNSVNMNPIVMPAGPYILTAINTSAM